MVKTSNPVRPDLWSYMGKRVAVVIDRLLGSRHPREKDIIYHVNYGYIPGAISGDGQPIDAYLLGVFVPVSEANAVVIGVALRADDVEDKLVVAPEGKALFGGAD